MKKLKPIRHLSKEEAKRRRKNERLKGICKIAKQASKMVKNGKY